MFSKAQLVSMNNDKKYSSFGWIKNINELDEKKFYKLYALKNSSLCNGRDYIALPADKILSERDYLDYNIFR